MASCRTQESKKKARRSIEYEKCEGEFAISEIRGSNVPCWTLQSILSPKQPLYHESAHSTTAPRRQSYHVHRYDKANTVRQGCLFEKGARFHMVKFLGANFGLICLHRATVYSNRLQQAIFCFKVAFLFQSFSLYAL